jgi:glycosyltransferase involved in cell wall biosynthesis
MARVVAVIPAFNEARTIAAVVSRVRPYTSSVCVVDDGSTDGTADAACAAGA